jgi:hypothetical protein
MRFMIDRLAPVQVAIRKRPPGAAPGTLKPPSRFAINDALLEATVLGLNDVAHSAEPIPGNAGRTHP